MDDRELLNQYVHDGSRQALDELVRRHIGMVYAVARREVGDAHLAEDVTQAVFLILMRRGAKIPRRAGLCGWLFNVTRFAAADARKSRARRQRHEREAAAMKRTNDGGNDASIAVAREELIPLLNDAVANLAGRDRDAVVMAYLEGKTHREVAQAQQITENAVRQRLFRALAKMRAHLRRKKVLVSDETLGAAFITAALHPAPGDLAARLALALHAPAAASSSAAIAHSTWRTLMMIANLKIAATTGAILAAVVLGGTAAVHFAKAQAAPDQPTATPASIQPGMGPGTPAVAGAGTAPFQAIILKDDKPVILLDGTWYELVAINTVPAAQLISEAGGPTRIRYVGSDLQSILQHSGQPAGDTVTLSIKNLTNGETRERPNIRMTAANRDALIRYESQHGNDQAVVLAKALPYRAIRWTDHTSQVEVGDTWYELQAVNDASVADMITFIQHPKMPDGSTTFANGESSFERSMGYQDDFSNELANIVTSLGHEVGPTVALTVKELDTGNVTTLTDVPMSEANRQAVSRMQIIVPVRITRGLIPQPPTITFGQGYDKLSPFQGVRLVHDGIQVQVNGSWYFLQAINDVALLDILAFENTATKIANWHTRDQVILQHLEEGLVEVLTRMNHKPGNSVKLSLTGLSGGQAVTLENVPMTAENRQALIDARAAQPDGNAPGQTQPPTTGPSPF